MTAYGTARTRNDEPDLSAGVSRGSVLPGSHIGDSGYGTTAWDPGTRRPTVSIDGSPNV